MNPQDIRRLSRGITSAAVAGRNTDPRFYHALNVLPNPDPVLRKAGQSDSVFDAIQADAHVMGELRAVRAGLLGFEYRVVAGGEDPRAQRAFELCRTYLTNHRPAPNMTWPDVIWNMGLYIFRGLSAHEVIWERQGDLVMPAELLDRPGRRFVFGDDNELRVLTRENSIRGVEPDPQRILLTRHMHSADNPYGWAVFSSCFWPYTFKHAGFKWFVKFCERLGIPWVIGRYPKGTPEPDQQALSDALGEMIEAAYAAVPEGNSIELIEARATGGSKLAQHQLINECNREMSKALTSQTLATEIQDTGARAASETARDREQTGHACDREQIAFTFDELFRWITWVNFGVDVAPPRFEFYEEHEARKERAETYEIASRLSPNISEAKMFEELNLVRAASPEDRLQGAPGRSSEFAGRCPVHGSEFAEGNDPDESTARAAAAADRAIEADFINPVAARLAKYEAEGRSLTDFLDDLPSLFSEMDDEQLAFLTREAMTAELLGGMEQVQGDA